MTFIHKSVYLFITKTNSPEIEDRKILFSLKTTMAGEDLDAIAAAELIQEAKRGSERAKVMGAMGWRKCPLPSANKVFLNNTLLSIIGHSKRHEKEREKNCKEERFSKVGSSSGRDSRKRVYSSYSPPKQKITKTDTVDKTYDCIISGKRADTKREFSLSQRKNSYSSYKKDQQIKKRKE